MLSNKQPIATVAVKDLKAAQRFYEATLGLRQLHADDETILFAAGGAQLLVYRSEYAGTNQATSVTWSVGAELEAIVRGLAGKGVGFEHYDMPGMSREGDVHSGGGVKVAWFKDPDGNIHSLVNV